MEIPLYVWLLIIVFFCSFLAALLFVALRPKEEPAPHELADNFKTMPDELTYEEEKERSKGQSVELGTCDYQRVEPRLFREERVSIVRKSFVLSEYTRFLNVSNVGPPGSGKSHLFYSAFLEPDIARKGNAVVVFDAEGAAEVKDAAVEYLIPLCRKYGRELIILPDEGFNPLAGPDEPAKVAASFANLYGQSSEIGVDDAAQHYFRLARLFIENVAPLYQAAYNQPMILRELYTLALSQDIRDRLLKDGAGTQEAKAYQEAIQDLWKPVDYQKSLVGLQVFLSPFTKGWIGNRYNQRNAPTLGEYIDRQAIIVIREGAAKNEEERVRGLMFVIALQQYIRHRDVRSSTHPLFVYMDEAQFYLNPTFPKLLTTNRKRRVGVSLGYQNFGQLGADRETIIGSTQTLIIHGGLKPDNAQLISDTIGKRWHLHRTKHEDPETGRITYTEKQELDYLIQPHEIMGIGKDEAIVLTMGDRETAVPRRVQKKWGLSVEPEAYTPPAFKPYPPPTYWEEHPEQDVGNGAEDNKQPKPPKPPRHGKRKKGDELEESSLWESQEF